MNKDILNKLMKLKMDLSKGCWCEEGRHAFKKYLLGINDSNS